jgi:hypothetical protein
MRVSFPIKQCRVSRATDCQALPWCMDVCYAVCHERASRLLHQCIVPNLKLLLGPINSAQHHEDIWRSEGAAPPLLNSALVGSEWSAPRPCHFTPGTHLIGGWVGFRAGLDVMKRQISCPTGNRTPILSSSSPWPNHYTDWDIPHSIHDILTLICEV